MTTPYTIYQYDICLNSAPNAQRSDVYVGVCIHLQFTFVVLLGKRNRSLACRLFGKLNHTPHQRLWAIVERDRLAENERECANGLLSFWALFTEWIAKRLLRLRFGEKMGVGYKSLFIRDQSASVTRAYHTEVFDIATHYFASIGSECASQFAISVWTGIAN